MPKQDQHPVGSARNPMPRATVQLRCTPCDRLLATYSTSTAHLAGVLHAVRRAHAAADHGWTQYLAGPTGRQRVPLPAAMVEMDCEVCAVTLEPTHINDAHLAATLMERRRAHAIAAHAWRPKETP